MRTFALIGIVAAAGMLALTQAANAERVCNTVCDHGACAERCVEHNDRVIIDRGPPPPPARGGVDIHAPGVNVDIGR
jgi:hypothetical protein